MGGRRHPPGACGSLPLRPVEEVFSSTGEKVRLARLSDWLAVSDHSDAIGVVARIIAGKPELIAVSTEPDFDPAQSVFYDVRVLEIPTPRWMTIGAKVFGVKRPEDVAASIQERAYTSPIWYTPASATEG